MTTQITVPTTLYDMVLAHGELGRIKKPTPREKAAFKKLSDALCYYAEGLTLVSHVPFNPETK